MDRDDPPQPHRGIGEEHDLLVAPCRDQLGDVGRAFVVGAGHGSQRTLAVVAAIRLTTWRGEAAVTLSAGELEATFLPGVSMLGVSFVHRGDEMLAPVGSLAHYRAGHAVGIPLLHPWANRLSMHDYRVGRVHVAVPRTAPVDPNGLPIHGTVHGQPFDVLALRTARGSAQCSARLDASRNEVIMASFPFPHVLDVDASLSTTELRITTTLRATGRRAVPASFGWHPYFQLPGTPRSRWRLRLPARRRARLDVRQIPTGGFDAEAAEDAPVGRRTFDDHYTLGRDHRFAITTDRRRLTLRFGPGYDFAQVYVPAGKPFAAIEPMVAPVNALVERTAPLVAPGTSYRATWRAAVTTGTH